MVSCDSQAALVGSVCTLYICYKCAQFFLFESKALVWLHDYSYGI